jgi:hypothetical protein
MIEEWLLDDPAELTRADGSGLLLDLASAGATVRRAARLAAEAGLDALRPEGRPRAALVVGHGTAGLVGDLLAAAAGTATQVTALRPALPDPAEPADPAGPAVSSAELRSDFALGLDWTLPGWAGPSDLVLILSTSGTEPGLVDLAQQAYARGCAIVSVAPAGSTLALATVQVRGLPLPFESSDAAPEPTPGLDRDLPQEAPSALWGLLAPVLALADRIGLAPVPPSALQAAADRLDDVAVRCSPTAESFDNPAKTLAIQLDGYLPLLWSDGPGTAAVGSRFAAMLAATAGRPALTGLLPEALTSQRGLFVGQLGTDADEDDFFRDRTEEPDTLRLKLLLLRRTPEPRPLPQPPSEQPAPQQPEPPSRPTASPAVARAHRLASDHQVGIQELASTRADTLDALAELIALTDFAAVYLGLAASASSRIH